jgi:hypothetical protein
MDTKATATLINGLKIGGRLTTDHSASSYGQPVFVDDDNQAINWADIVDISTAPAIGKRGGEKTSLAKTLANREKSNTPPKAGSKPRGRPRKPTAS